MITLNEKECQAIYSLLDKLMGCNPDFVFEWDGSDDPNDPEDSALAKIYHAAGQRIPDSLRSTV